MKQMHQPLRTKHGFDCTCGVFCGTTLANWRSHAADQKILNPGTATFNPTVTTPEMYALRKTWERAAKNVGHSMGLVKNRLQRNVRAMAKTLGPLAALSRQLDASCSITECDEPGTVQVVVGSPSERRTFHFCEEHAVPFRTDVDSFSLAETGRRLASERDDLIALGVDPAELEIPVHPEDVQ